MANKTLTAKVRLDITGATRSIKQLDKLINNLNKSVNKVNANKLQKQFSKTNTIVNKLRTNVGRVNTALNKTSTTAGRVRTALKNATSQTHQWASAQRSVNNSIRSGNSALGSLGAKLKGIAATYLGIMGGKAIISTSDTITSTQNRLNALNGGDANLTQQQMDKMYVSSNKVRMGYSDMMSNVSKSMTLAGDAFQGNIDNAIRFQEIMAETYALGGASAQEMSTSMYQMIQALGAGTLAGDELRSVREGAPLAYKAIEKFAQGVHNTTDSLKDMASEGMITSDMVVAAIMNSGNEIDKKFQETSWTFAQAWERIKNSAIKAFEPVSNAINKMLNDAANSGAFEKIESAFVKLSNVLVGVVNVMSASITWICDNWNWLKYVVGGVLMFISALLIKDAALAMWNAMVHVKAFLIKYKWLALIIAAIMTLVAIYNKWKTAAITTIEAICLALLVLAAICVIVGIVLNAPWLIWVGIALLAIAWVLNNFAKFCGFVRGALALIGNVVLWLGNLIIASFMLVGAILWNIIAGIVNFFMASFNSIGAVVWNCFAGIINFGMGLFHSLSAIATNIGIAFENAWIGAQNMFWGFIQGCLEGVRWLEPAINAVAKVFGKDGFTVSGLIDDVASKQQDYKDFVNVGDAWKKGASTVEYKDVGKAWNDGASTLQYQDVGSAWNNGYSTFGYNDVGAAYDSGYQWGRGVENSVNKWGSQFQNGNTLGSGIGNMLGGNNAIPNANDPAYDVSNAYSQPSLDALQNIDDNTKGMKDSMDLAEDELDWLRKVADMEWKNEFTTAEIKVEMTNNNSVSSENDLDGMISYLSDKLKEEMNNVATYGVHY